MIYRFVFVESVTMGWKESVCSPYSNYERTEAHQVMAFQLERQLCLLHLTSLFHNLENHENHVKTHYGKQEVCRAPRAHGKGPKTHGKDFVEMCSLRTHVEMSRF
jgi:hypothetical protein